MRRVVEVTTPAAWWWARSQGVVRRLVVAPAASGQPPALTPQVWVAVAATIDDVLRLARRTAPALSSRSVRVELTASLDDACWSLVQQYVLHDPPRWDGLDGTLHASRGAVRAMRAIGAPRVPVLDLGTARLVQRLGARGGREVPHGDERVVVDECSVRVALGQHGPRLPAGGADQADPRSCTRSRADRRNATMNESTMLHVAAPAAWVLAPAGAWRATDGDRRRGADDAAREPKEGWKRFRSEILAVLAEARSRASRVSDCLVPVPVPASLAPSTVSLMRRWLARGSAPTWHVESGQVDQGRTLVSAMFRAGFPTVPVISATTLQMVTYQQSVATPLLPPLTDDMVAQWQVEHIWWATPAGKSWRMLNPRHLGTTRTLLECLDSRAVVAAGIDPRQPDATLSPA
ncbi:hypothetical protein [Aeromicrobium massiliense]|uniref:hypothetical protein n=1 Tax=Aeromicrobium massiliense TaxID=1464554 RepID=UPI0005787F14|nr:hypothetical protein [Aeromicrobium massiliense]